MIKWIKVEKQLPDDSRYMLIIWCDPERSLWPIFDKAYYDSRLKRWTATGGDDGSFNIDEEDVVAWYDVTQDVKNNDLA